MKAEKSAVYKDLLGSEKVGLWKKRGLSEPESEAENLPSLTATSRRRGGVTSLERLSCARFGDSKAWLRGHFEQFQ